MTDKEENIKSRLKLLINNIDEFDSKFVTYKAESMKSLLKDTLEYINNKEQECEELQERTASIIYSLTGGRLSYSTYTLEGCEQAYHDQLEIDVERATKELQEKLQAKEQECEELKEQLDSVVREWEEYTELYKQALDEIENYVRDNSDFDKNDKLTSNTGAYDILEIINKAKAVSNAR